MAPSVRPGARPIFLLNSSLSPGQISVPALRGGDCSPTFIFRYLKCAPSAQSHPTFLVPLLPLDTTPNATGHEVRHFDTRKLSGEGTVRAIPTILVLLYVTSLIVSSNFCCYTNVTGLSHRQCRSLFPRVWQGDDFR
jgi:hypothetical protein